MNTENEVMRRHYNQLIGFTVKDVFIISPEDTDFFDEPQVAFIMKKGKNELLVSLLSDPEGNGTGFLEIEAWQDES